MKYNIKEILPLSSIIKEVRGRFGDYVFYMRNGNICARKYILPPNPRTKKQQHGRYLFAAAVKEWKKLDADTKEMWNKAAKSIRKRGYNLFISITMKEYLEAFSNEQVLRRKECAKHRRYVRIIQENRQYRIIESLKGEKSTGLLPTHVFEFT